MVTQVRWLVFLPGHRIGFTAMSLTGVAVKIFLVKLPGSRICRSILLMVFKDLHESGVAAGLEEKARFRVAMVHATMDCGKQERVDKLIPLWYSSCWHGPGQLWARLSIVCFSTC